MNKKINVLDVQIDNYTAKEAMILAMEYLQTECLNTVEVVSVNTLVKAGENIKLKDAIEDLDMIVAGDKAILEAAMITDHKSIQEIENQMFLKMLIRYMHKNHKRIFVLSETEEQAFIFCDYIERNYQGILLMDRLAFPGGIEYDDMILNRINGIEVECVISILDSPLQESFIQRNKALLNTKMWLGLGKNYKLPSGKSKTNDRIKEFMTKRIFKHQIEKHKKEIL
ncbi:MAG: WecB/TagA/CpsF family glycosyltransferase [Lachnospiraceae bacterium]